jgi:hypothetical protein
MDRALALLDMASDAYQHNFKSRAEACDLKPNLMPHHGFSGDWVQVTQLTDFEHAEYSNDCKVR